MWLKYNNDGLKSLMSTLSLHFCIFSVKKLGVNHDWLSCHNSWENSRIPLNLSQNMQN